jgi:hypothetical protein
MEKNGGRDIFEVYKESYKNGLKYRVYYIKCYL